jgi:hypothetical protein
MTIIWKVRNGWISQRIDPTVGACRENLVKEFCLDFHRVKNKYSPRIQELLDSLYFPFSPLFFLVSFECYFNL